MQSWINYALPLLGAIGFVAFTVRQLRLARTKGMVWSRNGYVFHDDKPSMFRACVVFYCVAVVWGGFILIAMLLNMIHRI
jgi:hypothetical protein